MNLPKGPDSLCFDKDEFMKVHAWVLLPGAGPWLACPPWPSGASPRASPAGFLGRPRPGRVLGGDLTALRSESLGLGLARCSLEKAVL